MRRRSPRPGQMLLEVVIVTSLLVTTTVGLARLAVSAYGRGSAAREHAIATFRAAEGIEAARSIALEGFDNLTNGDHGLDATSGHYVFTDTPDLLDGAYTRTITVETALRDSSDILVWSNVPRQRGLVPTAYAKAQCNPGCPDPHTKKVTSTVSWNPGGGERTVTVRLITYFTDWSS